MTVSWETEDSPDSTAPGRPLRSMQTGQNSIAPENSLPQLGQVRWGFVLMGLTVLQSQPESKATPTSNECAKSGQHVPWQIICPVSQAIASSFRVARHITFRNRIPIVGVLRRRAGDNDLRRWLRSIKSSIEVTLKPFSKSIIGAKRFHMRCSENNFYRNLLLINPSCRIAIRRVIHNPAYGVPVFATKAPFVASAANYRPYWSSF